MDFIVWGIPLFVFNCWPVPTKGPTRVRIHIYIYIYIYINTKYIKYTKYTKY